MLDNLSISRPDKKENNIASPGIDDGESLKINVTFKVYYLK
jgi:hypothetical protein